MTAINAGFDLAGAKRQSMDAFNRRRLTAIAVPVAILAYLVYVAFAFDLFGLVERARLDNARILLADTYSHKTHVTVDNRNDETSVSVEGETRFTYADDAWPDWVRREGDLTVVDLPGERRAVLAPDAVRLDESGVGSIAVVRGADGFEVRMPGGAPLPDWINASSTRVTITVPDARVTVTRARTEVLRYSAGWPLFFFTLDSPFYGKPLSELASLAVSGEQLRDGQSNFAAMATDFWTNSRWRHGDVAWALFETVLMAFLGTFGGALIAVPLAFAAARNFSIAMPVRFGVRRIFDFLRGVDGLIWTIILSRAFGPGPLTGALAILITDAGTFGKLFSEALENVDNRQVEGLRSTGANALQRNRFGVLPQVAPVIVSQVLYYLESNTRSATIIGALVGGGIGLLLTQAIQTQKDWEKVTYYIILTLIMVSVMDILSGWLRGKLIGRTQRPAHVA